MAFDWLMGTNPYVQQSNVLNPGQMGLQNQAISKLKGNQFDFAPIAAQAKRNFQSDTLPSIAARFGSLGGGNNLMSSNFAGDLGAASANMNTDLAAMQQYYNERQQDRNQSMAMTPSFENTQMQGTPGMIDQIIPALTEIAKAYMTGGASAAGQGGGFLEQLLKLIGGNKQSQGGFGQNNAGTGSFQNFGGQANSFMNNLGRSGFKSNIGGY